MKETRKIINASTPNISNVGEYWVMRYPTSRATRINKMTPIKDRTPYLSFRNVEFINYIEFQGD